MGRRGWYWPLVIVALLVASAGANLALVVIASRDRSFAVERDYYRKALAWDQTMAQERRNEALGWSIAVTLERVATEPDHSRLTARITDRAGTPIDGARVAVEAFHNARAGRVFSASLAPSAPGRYVATIPSARHGLWEVRVRVERGRDVFTSVATPELRSTS